MQLFKLLFSATLFILCAIPSGHAMNAKVIQKQQELEKIFNTIDLTNDTSVQKGIVKIMDLVKYCQSDVTFTPNDTWSILTRIGTSTKSHGYTIMHIAAKSGNPDYVIAILNALNANRTKQSPVDRVKVREDIISFLQLRACPDIKKNEPIRAGGIATSKLIKRIITAEDWALSSYIAHNNPQPDDYGVVTYDSNGNNLVVNFLRLDRNFKEMVMDPLARDSSANSDKIRDLNTQRKHAQTDQEKVKIGENISALMNENTLLDQKYIKLKEILD